MTNPRALCLSFLLLLSLPASIGAQVLAPDVREKRLESAREVLAQRQEPAQEAGLEAVRDPFYLETPAQPLELKTPGTTAQAQPQVQVRPRKSDAEVLVMIARSFRPTGSLILGERKLLILPSGRSLKLGASFKARYEEDEYTVEVTDITQTGYTLRLNNETLLRTFNGDDGNP